MTVNREERVQGRARSERNTRRAVVASLAAALLAGSAPAAHAAGMDEASFERTKNKYTWLIAAQAFPVQYVTYLAGTPNPGFFPVGEVMAGSPYTRVQSTSAPGVSDGFAALYYPSYIVDDGVLETAGLPGGSAEEEQPIYRNPTLVRCANPPHLGKAQKTENKLELAGGIGPVVHADCTPGPNDIGSHSATGPLNTDGGTMGLADSQSHLEFTEAGTVTVTSRALVQNMHMGELELDAMHSDIKLVWPINAQEPNVTYSIRLSGVTVNGQALMQAGKSVAISGTDIPVGEVAAQFRDQINAAGATAKDGATFHLAWAEPEVKKHDDREYTFQAPSVGIVVTNAARKSTFGEYNGIGLGFARTHALWAIGGGGTSVEEEDVAEEEGGGSFYRARSTTLRASSVVDRGVREASVTRLTPSVVAIPNEVRPVPVSRGRVAIGRGYRPSAL